MRTLVKALASLAKTIEGSSASRRAYLSSKEGTVDRIGAIDQTIARLVEEREKLADKLKKRSDGPIVGTAFKAKVYDRKSTWLDHGRVKRRLGVEDYAKCFKSKVSRMVTVTAIGESSEDQE